MSRDFCLPGRSATRALDAMVATSHPLATATGLDILKRGGTAMDAAIAAAAVLAVVEPAETGIGGDCFALYAPNGQVPPIAFNGSGRAPAAAELGWFRDQGLAAIAPASPHAVTVPGAVDAWWQLHQRFGRLDFAALLAPAIGYARDGHVVHDRVEAEWRLAADLLAADPGAAAAFLPGGRVPRAGEVFRNPDLAASLERIARHGRAGFYEGETAQALVAHLASLGGLHSLDDLAAAKGEFVEPIAADYRGATVYQLPPNTQGVIALLILALLEAVEPDGLAFDDPRRIHLAIEAARIGLAVRNRMIGDRDTGADICAGLSDPAWIGELAAGIDPRRASRTLPPLPRREANTVYLSVVDRDRNAASFINSVYHAFGSGLCPPGTGIVLQNRGVSFRLEPGHPNAIAPGRRPMHTIIPGMVGRDGRAVLSFGVMGGDYQPVGHAHVLAALYRYGLGLQEACDAPRYMPVDDAVEVETGVDAAARAALTHLGHRVVAADDAFGGAQMIALDWERGTLTGASDPRKDGAALGF